MYMGGAAPSLRLYPSAVVIEGLARLVLHLNQPMCTFKYTTFIVLLPKVGCTDTQVSPVVCSYLCDCVHTRLWVEFPAGTTPSPP